MAHFWLQEEETQSKKLRSKLEKESSPNVNSAESDKKQDLQKIESLTEKQYKEKHTEAAMKDILGVLAEYQAEE